MPLTILTASTISSHGWTKNSRSTSVTVLLYLPAYQKEPAMWSPIDWLERKFSPAAVDIATLLLIVIVIIVAVATA